MAQENEVVKKLKEINEGLKNFSSSNPYDNKLKELEERILQLELNFKNNAHILTTSQEFKKVESDVNKKQSSKRKPVSKKSNRTLPSKKLVGRKSREDRKIHRR